MLRIIETRKIKVFSPITRRFESEYRNICIGRNGKEIAKKGMNHFYLIENGTKLGRKEYSFNH